MSHIGDLIAGLCPDGVEHKTLGEVGELIRGRRFTKADYVEEGLGSIHYGEIYTIYGTWATEVYAYVRPELRASLRLARTGDIVIAATGENAKDVCKAVAWLGVEEVAVHDDCYIFRHDLDPKYVAYFFQSSAFQEQKTRLVTESKLARISGANLAKIRMPVPPAVIQREIVNVLDRFSDLQARLEAELKAELDLRSLQHVAYRQHVLDSASSAPTAQLRDVVDLFNAKAHEKLVDPTGTVALMTARFVSSGEANRFVRTEDVLSPAYEGDVALVMSDLPNGKALARTFYVDVDHKYAANQRVCLLRSRDPDRLLPRFLHYVMDRNSQLLAYNNGTDQTHLKKDYILDVRIPMPLAREQERVATILERLDGIVRDLAIVLDAELAARRKQYEHYRDMLLTFKERAA